MLIRMFLFEEISFVTDVAKLCLFAKPISMYFQ